MKISISVSLEQATLNALTDRARELDRSVSSLINAILAKEFGLQVGRKPEVEKCPS